MEGLSIRTPLVLGHRGASAYAPENTLAAFELAVGQGADGIEFDVQLSADGWPVVMHDSRVERTTNGHGEVAKLSLSELRSLDAGDGRPPPTLDEVFDFVGRRLSLLNVEIKGFGARTHGIEEAVAECILSHGLVDQTIVSSFDPRVVRCARRLLPRQTLVGLIRAPGLLKLTRWLVQSDTDHPHHSLIDEAYMRWARKRGFHVYAWTVDEPTEAARLARLGVDAIISNKPDLIRTALEQLHLQ
jgi:glycerophosphoryl diester phosphodiesterase